MHYKQIITLKINYKCTPYPPIPQPIPILTQPIPILTPPSPNLQKLISIPTHFLIGHPILSHPTPHYAQSHPAKHTLPPSSPHANPG